LKDLSFLFPFLKTQLLNCLLSFLTPDITLFHGFACTVFNLCYLCLFLLFKLPCFIHLWVRCILLRSRYFGLLRSIYIFELRFVGSFRVNSSCGFSDWGVEPLSSHERINFHLIVLPIITAINISRRSSRLPLRLFKLL
jgi:hypothetical protein